MDPQISVYITDEKNCSIVIDTCTDSHDETLFIVYKNVCDRNTVLKKIPNNKFQFVFFERCTECRIFVKCKLLKLMLNECTDVHVSVLAHIIGMIEFFKCKSMNVYIHYEAPITRIENCESFNIFQSKDMSKYLVKLSNEVYGFITDPKTKQRLCSYELGKIFWDLHEQRMISFSKDGFQTNTEIIDISVDLFVIPTFAL
jgi:hypothetical protein